MPRLRLTLGRLMAWIALAAVNLAVAARLAEKARRTPGAITMGEGAVVLGCAYVFAYLAYRSLRARSIPITGLMAGYFLIMASLFGLLVALSQ